MTPKRIRVLVALCGILSTTAVLAVIFIPMAQNLWTAAAAVALIARGDERPEAPAGRVSQVVEAPMAAASWGRRPKE